MSRIFIISIFAAGFLALSQPAIAESYLCIGEVSGGLQHKNDKWQSQVFTTGEDKFLITGKDSNNEYKLKHLHHGWTIDCSTIKNSDKGIICGEIGHYINFRIDKLRYIEINEGGYLLGESAKNMKSILGNSYVHSSASVTGGKCTKLDIE